MALSERNLASEEGPTVDLRPLAKEFLTHLRVERRLSPNTARAYDRDRNT